MTVIIIISKKGERGVSILILSNIVVKGELIPTHDQNQVS